MSFHRVYQSMYIYIKIITLKKISHKFKIKNPTDKKIFDLFMGKAIPYLTID